MNETVKDAQSQNISRAIKELLTLLKGELIERILQIKDNVNSKENFNLLKRLERSIDQFIKRDKNLYYIGFLGHYSSGKSSTINSLLKLRGSREERNENINPTDDQITLITNSSNNDQVVKQIRTGKVPIVTVPIDNNEFLKDKVIMDTPGSGDPSLIEEIVRDSLPLCDLIVYCISAANPIDSSDIPLLTEKERNLQNIPTLYLITRGNEFKRDSLKLLTTENLDESKAKKALTELASRMKDIADTIILSYEDYIIIDNKDNYNINFLFDKINLLADPNSQNLIKLFSHKIDFFTRTSKNIKRYFIDIIDEKLATIENFVLKAQTNIQNYQEKTDIGSDKLINSWRGVDEKINQIIDGAVIENNYKYTQLDTPDEFNNILTVKIWHKSKLEIFKRENDLYAYKLEEEFYNKAYDKKDRFIKEMAKTSVQVESISREYVNDYLTKDTIGNIDIVLNSVKYKTIYDEFYNGAYNYFISDRYDNFKKNYESIQNRIRNKSPLQNFEKQIEIAKSTLSEIFGSYNEAVQIYRVAAFSSEAKKYIHDLGLSKELDDLDSTSVDFDYYKSVAEKEIFKQYEVEILKFTQSCEKLSEKLSDIIIDSPILQTADNEQLLLKIQNDFIESAKFEQEKLSESYSSKLDDFLLNEVQEINSALYKKSIEKENELKLLKKKRLKYYIIRIIPSMILLLLTIITFYIFPKVFSNSLSVGGQWIIGVMSNIAFAAINTLIIAKRDKYPTFKLKAIKRIEEDKRQVVHDIINKDFEDFKSQNKTKISNEFNNWLQTKTILILNSLISVDMNGILYQWHKNSLSNELKLKNIIQEYSQSLNSFKIVTSKILNDTNNNKKILFKQSDEIKNKSITPSFNLLFKTKKDISNAKELIDKVDFTS